MNTEILQLLRENARLTDEQIARRVGLKPEEVAAAIEELEKKKAIVAYRAIVNPDVIDDAFVEAIVEVKINPGRTHQVDVIAKSMYDFSEVKSLYLSSGEPDFVLLVEARTLPEVARFLTEKLAMLETVVSTTTHFILRKYKKEGVVLVDGEPQERLAISP
jgi:DNA-binding Lrp family transcriptional regulator